MNKHDPCDELFRTLLHYYGCSCLLVCVYRQWGLVISMAENVKCALQVRKSRFWHECFSVSSFFGFDSLFVMNEWINTEKYSEVIMKRWDSISLYTVVFSLCLFFCFQHLCLSWWKMMHAARWLHAVRPHPSLICSHGKQALSALSLSSGCSHLFLSVLLGGYQKSCTECQPCPAGTFTTDWNCEDSCHRCFGDCRPGKETMSHFY